MHGTRQGRKGRLFLHPLTIITKGVDIPVAGRREVDLPVLRRATERDKELKAGCLPEPAPAAGRAPQSRKKEIIQVAAERITDQKAGCGAGKGAGNLEVGSKALFLERLESKRFYL